MRMSSCVFILPLHIPVCCESVILPALPRFFLVMLGKQQNYKIKLVTSCDFTLNHILTVVFFHLNLAFCLPECQTGK